MGLIFISHFSDEETEVHGGKVICLRAEMWWSPGFEPQKSSSRAYSI